MMEISINVHGGPGEGNHTWSKFVLEILKMWDKKRFSVWSDFVYDSIVFLEDELKLVVVHLKLVFLEENNFGALWDVDSNSRKTFGFSDESKDLRIEVNVKFVVLWMSNYQSGLKSSFSFLNLMRPFLSPKILE
jgi:spore maturation protein CgeB